MSTGLEVPDPAWPKEPLDDSAFSALLMAARISRVAGLLAVNIESGLIPTTEQQALAAYDLATSAVRGDMAREHALIDVAGWLHERDVPLRVLKGAAIAHLDEVDPIRRSYGDIDLLIPGDRFAETVSLLAQRGFSRTHPEPQPGFDGRFSKGVCVRRGDEEVDLHRTLAPGPFGMRIPVSDLWEASDTFELHGAVLHALPAELRLLHAAYHAILGRSSPKLVALRDLAVLANRTDLDVGGVATVAQRWDGTIVLRRAVASVLEEFDLDLVDLRHELSNGTDPRRQRRAMRSYGGGPGRYARQAAASITSIPGWRDRSQYVRALLLPQDTYVSGRYRGRLERLKSGLTALLRHKR